MDDFVKVTEELASGKINKKQLDERVGKIRKKRAKKKQTEAIKLTNVDTIELLDYEGTITEVAIVNVAKKAPKSTTTIELMLDGKVVINLSSPSKKRVQKIVLQNPISFEQGQVLEVNTNGLKCLVKLKVIYLID